MEMPERFFRPLDHEHPRSATGDVPLGAGLSRTGARYNNKNPDFGGGTTARPVPVPHLTPAEAAAYDAPYPDATFKCGVAAAFPTWCPTILMRRARYYPAAPAKWFRTKWMGRTFMAVGMKDPVLGPPCDAWQWRKLSENCPPPHEVAEGGHFLQELGCRKSARKALEVL